LIRNSRTPMIMVGSGATDAAPEIAQLAELMQAPVDRAEICARLNALEGEEIDFVPRLGAWGLHAPDDLPGYSCFIPSAEPLGALHMTLMWWCVRRAAWLRDRFWTAKVGVSLR